MIKAELVSKISDKTGIEKRAVFCIVEELMATVKDAMVQGENVYLRGFGTFEIVHKAAKVGRNITKNTSLEIPAHNVPKFKPCKEFVSQVKDNVK